jgi:hypothetical protein
MARNVLVLAAAALLWGCNDGGTGNTEEFTCAILSPTTDTLAHETQTVEVGFSGPVARIELLAGDAVVASADVVDDTLETISLTWDSAAGADGAVVLTARALDAASAAVLSEPVTVDVDNTAPVVAFSLERFGIVRGSDTVALDLVEAHPATVRAVDQFGTIYEGPLEGGAFPWDATAAEERVHWLDLTVTDAVGHVATVTQFPLIVVNNGDAYAIEYDPSAQVAVPVDYATAEYDTRGMVPTHAGVKRIISWMTWDASSGWLIDYSIGEGLCPHRGIEFVSVESRAGEIVIELGRDELPSSIVNLFPEADRASTTFPSNTDPLTFGTFFGHARPLEPADRVGQSLPIEMHMVLIDEAPTS